MKRLHSRSLFSKTGWVRLLTMVVAALAITVLSTGFTTSGTSEAVCWVAASQCTVVSGISICDNLDGTYNVSLGLASGNTPGTVISSCGLGGLELVSLSPGGTGCDAPKGTYTMTVTPTSSSFTVQYRVKCYSSGGSALKYVGSYSFSGSGGCVSTQSCPF